jgi:hypothetical protein
VPPAVRKNMSLFNLLSGGANRNRTDDLLNAIQALSQLSYGPFARHWDPIVGPCAAENPIIPGIRRFS